MSVSQPQPVIDAAAGKALLSDLCRPFVHEYFAAECSIVQPENIPHPEDHLLVHHDHMTIVLREHHGSEVAVHVLEEKRQGDCYTRKVKLTPAGGDRVVEWGIARIDFRFMPQEVQREILARRSPLGAILTAHDVHRRIKPRYFLRFPEGSAVLKLFGAEYDRPVYGRLGTIYCDGEPCIEVLEIVV